MSLFPKFQNRGQEVDTSAVPAIPAILGGENRGNRGNRNPMSLDVLNTETRKTPQLDLLTEVELEAFNGWYATMRKPKFNLSHEEATIKAWQLLIESMESMYKRGGGRWLKKSD
ncbi:MAG: hypothetical protein H8E32_18095 [Nitrospinae bacterium]|nr:hypothetical protein [Nitrospinota bacterium]